MPASTIEIGLDNSALSDVLNGAPGVRIRDLERALPPDVEIVVSDVAISEAMFQGPPGHSARRAEAMHRLERRLGSRLVLAAPLGETLRHEEQNRRPQDALGGSVRHPRKNLKRLVAELGGRGFAAWRASIRDAVRDWLGADRWWELDEELRGELALLDPPLHEADLLASLQSSDFGRWWLESRHEPDVALIDDVLARPGDFRALSLLAGYAHLNAVAVATRTSQRGGFSWLTSRRGDWIDAGIAANHAYSTHLVAGDRGLLRRLEFLGERGRAFVAPMSVADFAERLRTRTLA